MNYYQQMDSYYYDTHEQNEETNNFDNKSIFKDVNGPNSVTSNDNNYDPEYDLEVNKLLQEIEEDFLLNENSSEYISNKEIKCNEEFENSEREKFEDYYDEFSEDSADDNIPLWYNQVIQNKVKETKSRLEVLSTFICYTCTSNSTRNQIIRIEQDHNTPFCKLDYPKHPPFSKAWQNYWRFNCTIKCKINSLDPSHAHTSKCEILLLEHVNTGITTKSDHINVNEFPPYIMHVVELFQDFATITYNDSSYLKSNRIYKTTYEKPTWSYIKLRSNYKNELMLIACGKCITPFLKPLRKYFSSGPGRSCNVVSLYCINAKWSQKKHQLSPLFITGCLELRDKIGPITVNYSPKTNISFNSVQAHLLGKTILEYLSPNMETTLIDLGCNYGVLSLMLAHKCDKVIGLYTLDYQIKMAEEIKSYNNLHNTSFIVCNPKEVHTKCSSLIKKCISVAVLNLASPFGKSFDAIKALRNLPSIWRVIIYGSFTKEFHKYIAELTSKNDCIGDEFLPMQGSILDKSPTNPNEYDIIILFERKALIEPSIELIASGPTVNVKTDINHSWTSKFKNKLTVKIKEGFDNKFDHCAKNLSYKPFSKTDHSSKFDVFDSPSISKQENLKPEIIPQSIENKCDRLCLPKSRDSVCNSRSITHNIKKNDLKRMTDSSSLSNLKNKQLDYPSTSKSIDKQSSCTLHSKSNKKQFDYLSMIKKEKAFDCPAFSKAEENQSKCLDLSKNKKEYISSHLQTVKLEFEPLLSEKEDGELSPETIATDIRIPVIKSEPINFNNESEFVNIVSNALIKCENMLDNDSVKVLTDVAVKVEPSSPSEIIKVESSSPLNVSIKTESATENEKLTGMKISPISDLEEFENMVTPVSIPAALVSGTTFSPPPLVSTNFTTIDGFQLSVKPNESFLSYKKDPDANGQPPKTPPHSTKSSQSPEAIALLISHTEQKNDTDVKFIKEKKSDDHIHSVINVKTEEDNPIKQEEKKSKDKVSKDIDKDCLDADLRKLIEKRKNIKKQLDRDREQRKSKQRYDRSPSPVDRKYRSPFSPSDRGYKFSPMSRYRLPLSPNRISGKSCRSPLSPNKTTDRKCRSPLSPNRTSDKRCRSSLSPNKTTDSKCRSPLFPNKTTDKRYRSSLSPTNKCFKRSPQTPMDKRFKRSPQSPNYRSPVSPSEWRYSYRRSKSPPDIRRARSPMMHRPRSRSRSPLSRSPSPSKKYFCNQYNHFPKYYKKRKTSDDAFVTSEKRDCNSKCGDQWEIPVSNSLSDRREMTSSNSSNVLKNMKQETK